MTRDICSIVGISAHAHVVPLRTSGAGSPLFCFPGSGGNVYIFREMVSALPEGRPIYAIDMEWLCEADQDFSIEQLATLYLPVVRKLQQSGPYHFCGYSFGGLVAYEMATRLINEGDAASLVALLDVPNPALRKNLSEADSVKFRKTYLTDRLRKYGSQLARGDLKTFMGNGSAFIVSRAGKCFMPSIKAGFRRMNRPVPGLLRANDPGFLKAWHAYNPKPYPKGIVCFRVEDRGPEHGRDPSMGWEACAMGGVQVHVVPGGHVDMMNAPSVAVVADKLAGYLGSGSPHE